MTNFQLYPHCHLVNGNVYDVIYDILQDRIFWVHQEPFQKVVRLLEEGKTLEEVSGALNMPYDEIKNFVDFLCHLDYGTYQEKAGFPGKYTSAILPIQEKIFGLIRPFNKVFIEIATECTYRCSVCGFKKGCMTSLCACGAWPSPLKSIGYDISKLVYELSEWGCNEIVVKGGDPFLNPDALRHLVSEARDKNIKISLHTPGILINDQEWDFIKNNFIHLLIPVFGSNPGIHDSITGVSGSFQALEVLLNRWSKERAFPLTVQIIQVNDQALYMNEMIDFLKKYNVESFIHNTYMSHDNPYGNNKTHGEAFQMLLKKSYNDFKVTMDMFFRFAIGHVCWQDSLAFNFAGEVMPCIAARDHVIGNIANESLFDILRTERHRPYRNAGNDTIPSCHGCEFRYACWSCSLMTERIYGTWKNQGWNCCYDPLSGKMGNIEDKITEIIENRKIEKTKFL
ncbi:MAG: radical SAM protein [Acidobacteria bacterium]|jgi:radical SAM protein with 4Fe4S-binding SPASM domain|nr:radical SAM protein [Acidobacteriota bacterium]